MKLTKNSIVQFNERHQWCGCLGIVKEVKNCRNDTRYMIGVPIPQQGAAYIFVMESKNEVEWIGDAVMVEVEDNNDEMKQEKSLNGCF